MKYDALRGKTALYIEDEVDVLQNISELLSHFFNTFHIASDAETGYEIFMEHPVDVLLVDIELPGMNGIELIKKIRKEHKDLPIVVISAYTKTDYLLESIELKLDKYIVKPLTSRKIKQLLETLDSDFSNDAYLKLSESVTIDRSSSLLLVEAREYPLTKKELHFLTLMTQKRIVSYDEIITIWEEDVPTENAIRSFIKHLRKKLPEDFIRNRNGIGYYMERTAL